MKPLKDQLIRYKVAPPLAKKLKEFSPLRRQIFSCINILEC